MPIAPLLERYTADETEKPDSQAFDPILLSMTAQPSQKKRKRPVREAPVPTNKEADEAQKTPEETQEEELIRPHLLPSLRWAKDTFITTTKVTPAEGEELPSSAHLALRLGKHSHSLLFFRGIPLTREILFFFFSDEPGRLIHKASQLSERMEKICRKHLFRESAEQPQTV